MSTFNLEIITPYKIAYREEVERIIVRTTEGDMGILANHAPLVSELSIGEMKIQKNGEVNYYFISGGLLEISKSKVTVLADKAIDAKDIDVEEAKREKEILEAKLLKIKEDSEAAAIQRGQIGRAHV